MSEHRELWSFEGDIDEAKEVDCFLGVEEVADLGSPDVNHSDDGR